MAEKRSIKLRWRDGGRAPEKMHFGWYTADGHMAYFRNFHSVNVHAHNAATGKWNTLPKCPYIATTLVVVNGVLTAVGGYDSSRNATNKLLSLVGEGKWVEQLPCMPTERSYTAAVCSGKTLAVIGGESGPVTLKTVELLDIDSLQWFIASEPPHPLSRASATVCGENLYLVGGFDYYGVTKSVLTCSLSALVQSAKPAILGGRSEKAFSKTEQVWRKVASLPVFSSTCASLNGQLIAVGGWDSDDDKTTNSVYAYDPTTDCWDVISTMPTARHSCLIAVLPGNQLMVVGGLPGGNGAIMTDKVEVATFVVYGIFS